jgi:peptidoglycan/LPS O-acetylase OafA/YrhL
MPGLDVARGLAILMVLADHGLASDPSLYQAAGSPWMHALGYTLRLGHFGVHLFFILSGLLITGILLDTRHDRDFYRNFYARRALRILPAYLLMLAVLLASHSITGPYVLLCMLFLCNAPGLFGAGNQYPALWSLAVEEQFYLVWPATVRRLSTRGLVTLCAAIVVLTPALRFALLYGPHSLTDIHFKPWAVADFFATGALLTLAYRNPTLRPRLQTFIAPLLASGALLIALQHIAARSATGLPANLLHAIYLEPWLLALSGFVLWTLLRPGIASSLLGRPLVFLANISYGLYLCHPFLFDLVDRHWPLPTGPSGTSFLQLLLRFAAEATLAIAIATLSRFTYEEFFLRLKPKHPLATTTQEAPPKIT